MAKTLYQAREAIRHWMVLKDNTTRIRWRDWMKENIDV
jgi:hypothetical protein